MRRLKYNGMSKLEAVKSQIIKLLFGYFNEKVSFINSGFRSEFYYRLVLTLELKCCSSFNL